MRRPKTKEDKALDEALDVLIAKSGHSPEAIMGDQGLLAQLTKRLVERVLEAELTHHLKTGRSPTEQVVDEHGERAEPDGNCRNGFSAKTVLGDSGETDIAVPRDRHSSFEPMLVPKWQKKLPGFEEKIIALYARDMTVRNKAVYLALGAAADGTREVLGLWIEQNEGAKFWLKVMNELRNRGVEDLLIAVVDGLKGFPEAITTVFPEAQVQTCIVHLIRHSLTYCSNKDREAVAAALKLVYRAESETIALQRLAEFEAGEWGRKYPTIAASWRRAWEQVIPFFVYPAEVRKIIYTTNAIESLNMQLRKIIKNRGHFPSDEAATKLMYLALRNITAKWTKPPASWKAATNQFAIQFGSRFFDSPHAVNQKTTQTQP